jgi:hypothetical protein
VTLVEFLLTIAREPALIEEFQKDPETFFETHQLDAKARQLLTSGRLTELRVELNATLDVDGTETAILWIHVPWLHLEDPGAA